MQTEASSLANVRAQLTAVGYQFVQSDPRLRPDSDVRADFVAWASDAEGSLVPWVAVEVKSGAHAHQDLALQRLIRARDTLGTVEHYAVIRGRWFRADRSLRRMEAVAGPAAPEFGAEGWLRDKHLAISLLLDNLARAERQSDSGGRSWDDLLLLPSQVLVDKARPGIQLLDGGFVSVDAPVLWEARREALVQWLARSGQRADSATSDPVVAKAVAQLIGSHLAGVVLDPFTGTGSFLWEAIEVAKRHSVPARFVGFELNPHLAHVAADIARSAPLSAVVQRGDAFSADLPEADAVVSAPPAGVRLTQPWHLADGRPTTDGDLAALDLCIRRLKPQARAVLHLPVGVTFRQTGENFRRYLANEFRVAAVIGLPAGAMAGTFIRSVLLVIDRAAPGETFIAQLSEDWETQLGLDGAAMTAALQHLDGIGGD